MSEGMEGVVARVDEVYTEEALAANDGKTVPLRNGIGGPVIGEATFKWVPDEKVLKAEFNITDPNLAEWLQEPPPHIFDRG